MGFDVRFVQADRSSVRNSAAIRVPLQLHGLLTYQTTDEVTPNFEGWVYEASD